METDNVSAITTIKALKVTKQFKFIDHRHQNIKHVMKNNNIKLRNTPFARLKVGFFKNPLERVLFFILRELIAVENIPVAGKTIIGRGLSHGACERVLRETLPGTTHSTNSVSPIAYPATHIHETRSQWYKYWLGASNKG